MEGRRLSRPSWLVTYRDGLPVLLLVNKDDYKAVNDWAVTVPHERLIHMCSKENSTADLVEVLCIGAI